ncbi:MAG: cyclic nucleotide-binding domain-containing protein, partial [Flavobacteriaceae bacterium]|nr:cyclic nucleotide-binding domain-containing protein [Flavobacteriaceae bacterium]
MDFFTALRNENATAFKQKTYKRGELLVSFGATSSDIFLITSGACRIYLQNADSEHTIRFGYQNSLITALDSFIEDKPTVFEIQALRKTTAEILTRQDLENFIANIPDRLISYNEILKQLVIQQMEREHDLLTLSPVDRYNRVLARSPQLFQHIPLKY